MLAKSSLCPGEVGHPSPPCNLWPIMAPCPSTALRPRRSVGLFMGHQRTRRDTRRIQRPSEPGSHFETFLSSFFCCGIGSFLAGTIYELFVQSPSRNQVLAIMVWSWVLGDVAIVIGVVTVRALLRARRNAA